MKNTEWTQVTDGPCPLWWQHWDGEDHYWWSREVPDEDTTGWQNADMDIELFYFAENPLKPEFRIGKSGQVRHAKVQQEPEYLWEPVADSTISNMVIWRHKETGHVCGHLDSRQPAAGRREAYVGITYWENYTLREGWEWGDMARDLNSWVPVHRRKIVPAAPLPANVVLFNAAEGTEIESMQELRVGQRVMVLNEGADPKQLRVTMCTLSTCGEGQNVFFGNDTMLRWDTQLGPDSIRIKICD